MQVGDHSGLVEVVVIAKTARREVKGVLMFFDHVFRTIFLVPKQGKAALASKLLGKMTARSLSELFGDWHSELRLHRHAALEGKPQVARDSRAIIHRF
jgi:hypothetical protein